MLQACPVASSRGRVRRMEQQGVKGLVICTPPCTGHAQLCNVRPTHTEVCTEPAKHADQRMGVPMCPSKRVNTSCPPVHVGSLTGAPPACMAAGGLAVAVHQLHHHIEGEVQLMDSHSKPPRSHACGRLGAHMQRQTHWYLRDCCLHPKHCSLCAGRFPIVSLSLPLFYPGDSWLCACLPPCPLPLLADTRPCTHHHAAHHAHQPRTCLARWHARSGEFRIS